METVKFRDSFGQMRVGKICICEICKVEFPTRLNRLGKCCSRKCTAKLSSLNNSTLSQCTWCKKDFRRKNSQLTTDKSKSGLYFCTRKCKDEAQKLGGVQEIMPSHFGTRESAYSLKDCDLLGFLEKCVDCGIDKRYLLTLHHIDGNRENNIKTNLEIVCGNCHMKRHLDYVNNRWHLNYHKLTPRDKISEL